MENSFRWPTIVLLSFFALSTLFLTYEAPAQIQPPAGDRPEVADTIPPLPPTNLQAVDTPNDAGKRITLTWTKSPDDGAGAKDVKNYQILRAERRDGPYEMIAELAIGAVRYVDTTAKDGVDYYYKVSVSDGINTSEAPPSQAVCSKAQWFNLKRLNMLIAGIILSLGIIYFINKAKAGGELYIRKIAGLDAVNEAVGRATEMGRKVFFIPGIMDLDNVQTIAGLSILGQVARLTAEYGTELEVPVCRSVVMVTGRETVKEAYLDTGHPDAYHDEIVHYLTDDQFGYAAGVDGLMLREKPAAIFYQGAFYAESLILAETGFSVGAIQIAGTGMPSQLPFFITACDYTLIGEELFAASAYLSREPRSLGSIKGQDLGKAIILVILILGVVLETFGFTGFSQLFTTQ